MHTYAYSPEAIGIAVQRAADAGMYIHLMYICIKICIYIHTYAYSPEAIENVVQRAADAGMYIHLLYMYICIEI